MMPNASVVPRILLRALFIEPAQADRDRCVVELERAGYQVIPDVLLSADEVPQKITSPYDLVLSAYTLPNWTGLEAFQALQELNPQAPFILVADALGEEAVVECLKQGVADFVLKDGLARLPDAVRRALKEFACKQQSLHSEADLRRSQAELEARAQERAQELSNMNRSLRQEILECEQAQLELQESEQRFHTMVEAIPQNIWTATAGGEIDYANQRWSDYTGLSSAQSMGWGWLSALHAEDSQEFRNRWGAALQSGEPFEFEYRLRRVSDGRYRWHLGRALPLHNSQGRILKWFGTATDIQEQKAALQGQAELAAMRSDLVATISHELRTPLASLRGFSELMLTHNYAPEKRQEFLAIIHKESIRLTNLINNFLDLQRMESGQDVFHMEHVDLLVLIRESAALFAVLDVKHRLRLELPVTLPTVHADADQIRGALGNLLSNAFKYSPHGGDVVMGARVERDEVLLWVSDQGLGIPASALPHLFTKFYRVDNTASHSVGGTGLGLALVKQIIEFHRGRVWAESEYGAGTTFFIALPRLPQPAQGVAEAAVAPPASIQNLDILVVEDDSAFANLLLEHFRGAGLSVQQTGFAEQALEWCQQSAPRMLLLDIHLAGAMDGWDLLVALKTDEALQAIPVVVMSSSDPNMHGLALGGADYVLKSATQEALLQAVQRQVPRLQGKSLLIADDDAIFRARLSHLLTSLQAEVRQAANGFEAMERIAEAVPDLLILDLLMPVLDGFEVLRRLRHDRRTVKLRILVVTSKDLALSEKAYLHRKLASLVGKSEADLDYFSEIVNHTLGLKLPLSAGAVTPG